MSGEIARLGLAVDSSPVKGATVDLDAFARSADRGEVAAKRATAAASQHATAIGAFAAKMQGSVSANDNATAAINRHVLAIQNLIAAEARMGSDVYASRAADIAAYGTALDGLRAKFNPVFASIQQYRATLGEIRQAHAVGAISVNEMTAAIDRERSATLRAIEAAKGLKNVQQERQKGGISAGARQQAGFNAGQQLQDIFMMSALGQSPGALALQQGPQLATAIQQGGGLATLGAGLAQVFSLTTLITVGAVAATAAVTQWFMKGSDGANKMAEALDKNKKAAKDLADAYKLAGFNADALTQKSILMAESAERQSRRQSEKALKAGLKDLRGDTSNYSLGLLFPSWMQSSDVTSVYAPFRRPIDDLRKGLVAGKPDFQAFQKQVDQIAQTDPGKLRLWADILLEMQSSAAETAQQIQKLDNLNRNGRGDRVVGPSRMDAAAEDGRRILEQQRRERELKFRTEEDQFEAGLQQQRARTNAEKLAAAERTARAESGDTNADVRARRAVAEERTRQEVEARDARIQRNRAMERTLQQQRLELDLIGKTGGESAKLRYEFERMQELRDQAARTGDPINQKEVERIKAAAEAMGLYADALARARLNDDLQFERDQLGRTSQDQRIASRLRAAGLPVDLNGAFAKQMRENDYFSDARDSASGFINTFGQELIDSGGDIGKSLGRAIQNALLDATSKAWGRLADEVGTAFANWLTGSTSLGKSSGGAFGTASGFADMLFGGGAANDNGLKVSDYAPKFLSGIGSPGSLASNASYSVANATSFIKQYASSIGIDPDIALKVAKSEGLGAGVWQSNFMKDGFREPSFGPFQLLKGGQGTGFGTGLGNKFMQQTGLDPADPANWQQSTAFALDQAKAGGWGPWYGAKNQGITGFTGIDQNVTKASGALDKLTTSSIDTAQSLSGGLGKLGDSLSQFPSAPMMGSGGGGGGLLGGLLGGLGGGLSSAFSGTKAFSWLTKNPGNFIGLYADGTENAPEGWAWVGERGPELRKLRSGDVIRSNPRSMEMAAEARRGGGGPTFSFNIDARGSTMTRAEYEQIAREQVNAGLAQYNDNQVRGGFGTTQQKYGSYKG